MDEKRFTRWTTAIGNRLSRRAFGGVVTGTMAASGVQLAHARKKKEKKKLATCTPHCSGKQCGDNGCGGSCGSCGGGQSCNSAGK
jgi:hypothetical protein